MSQAPKLLGPLVALSILTATADAGPAIGAWGMDLDGRNVDVRPQDDFFRHANGTWLEEFVIPEDLPGFGTFIDLFLQSESHIREIIEEVSAGDPAPGSDARKIADLYAGYLDRDAIEAAGIAPLSAELAAVRALASHEDVARYLARSARYGTGTPFAYFVDQDSKAPDRYIAHFIQSGTGLPDREYYLDAENERYRAAVDARRTYLAAMLAYAGEPDGDTGAERVLALEKSLAESHWPSEETRDVEATYNKMTQQELATSAPGFPWTVYFDELGLDPASPILVQQPSAYTGMAVTFSETPLADWRAYLVSRVMGTYAQYLPAEIDDTQFQFISAAFTGSSEQRAREKRAVQFVNGCMGHALGRLYVERHFSPEAKARVTELVSNLLRAMDARLDGLDWMSAETKARAKEKLARFGVKIGYPDEWRDYSGLEIVAGDLVGNARRATLFEYERNRKKLSSPVDRREWLMTPQTVNAYYNAQMNEIVFPAAILQPPFFDPEADDAVNYGSIGAIIGHEIGHGFDDQGRKYDGAGMQRDWWTAADAEQFQKRADMLVARYDAFSPLEGMHVNGKLTLGENIGDVGGLEIAYHAYRLSLDGQEAPVLDGLTGDQRFFLGYAQAWRGKMRDQMMAAMLASNPHSPVEYRVNGALPNIDAWYAAFDVDDGDAMYLAPDERVRIW